MAMSTSNVSFSNNSTQTEVGVGVGVEREIYVSRLSGFGLRNIEYNMEHGICMPIVFPCGPVNLHF